jgi:hypothetical protein
LKLPQHLDEERQLRRIEFLAGAAVQTPQKFPQLMFELMDRPGLIALAGKQLEDHRMAGLHVHRQRDVLVDACVHCN